jgi:hypothetical protein
MRGDPKSPNAWWALKFRLAEMLPNFGRARPRRLIWIIPLMILLLAIEIFFFNKMIHS